MDVVNGLQQMVNCVDVDGGVLLGFDFVYDFVVFCDVLGKVE